jgi:UDP-glucose 4-epimerase
LDVFFGEKIEKVYHFASVVGVEKYLNTPEEVIRVNVLGTQNIVKLVKEHSVDVVFASTSEVYGKNPKVPWSEEDDRVLGSTSLERWTYSTSKATAEHLLMAQLKDSEVNWTIVRYFNVYGPRQNANFVVSANLKNYILRRPLLCHNDGNQTRCYSYIADIVDATLKLAECKKSGIYNVGSDVEVSINELLVLVNNVSDYKEEVSFINTDETLGEGFEDIPRRVPNTGKIQNEIDWKPNTLLADGLVLTYKWMNDNPWWLKKEL